MLIVTILVGYVKIIFGEKPINATDIMRKETELTALVRECLADVIKQNHRGILNYPPIPRKERKDMNNHYDGYLALFWAIPRSAVMDILKYKRYEKIGQMSQSNGKWAGYAITHRQNEMRKNYNEAKEFVLSWFGEDILYQIENGHRLKKAA